MSDDNPGGFKPGFDPRRNMLTPGPGRTPEYDLKNVTGPTRIRLIEKICEIMRAPILEVEGLVKNLDGSLGDHFAAQALLKAARQEPTLDNLMKILKILGHKFEEPATVNINMSLEDLITAANNPEERVVETPDGTKVIVRKKQE